MSSRLILDRLTPYLPQFSWMSSQVPRRIEVFTWCVRAIWGLCQRIAACRGCCGSTGCYLVSFRARTSLASSSWFRGWIRHYDFKCLGQTKSVKTSLVCKVLKFIWASKEGLQISEILKILNQKLEDVNTDNNEDCKDT